MLCILCIRMIINQAMLKLTHSFCRYTKLRCETINFSTTHVKRYSYLGCGKNTCATNYAQYSIISSLTHTCQQRRLFANIKRKLRLKLPHNSSSEARINDKMDNSLLPSVVIARRGGGNPEEDENSMDVDISMPSTSSRPPINKRKDKIPPNFRSWEQIAFKANGEPFRFKVVSYNVLAQYLLECHPYLYTECDPEDLQWNVRFERIFKEIMELDPDVLCLQEVQSTHIKNFYVRFEQSRYYGIFKQKTGHREDGCAIYFKKDVFDLDDHLTVEYYQPDMPILNRDNVGLIMKLVPRDCPTTAIVVATTHLLYNPKRGDVRVAQMKVMLAELDRFAYYQDDDGKDTGYYPIVLTGDFNSLPESGVVKLLDSGKVSVIGQRGNSDWRRVAVTDNCQHLSVVVNRPRGILSDFSMTKIFNSDMVPCGNDPGAAAPPTTSTIDQEVMRHGHMFNNPILRHPLKLASVYSRINVNNKEEATTFQNSWVTVDYIYFSCCNNLRLLERLRLPTRQECKVLGHLPNDVYGSDHLVLAAHFEIRQNYVAH